MELSTSRADATRLGAVGAFVLCVLEDVDFRFNTALSFFFDKTNPLLDRRTRPPSIEKSHTVTNMAPTAIKHKGRESITFLLFTDHLSNE